MVKFKEVDPVELPNLRLGRRGRVSYPILKGFLETGMFLAQLDRTGVQQSFQSLYSSLNNYAKSHKMPIKIFSRQGEIYMMRLDIDENGDPTDWDSKQEKLAEAKPITPDEVNKRYEEEKGQTTK